MGHFVSRLFHVKLVCAFLFSMSPETGLDWLGRIHLYRLRVLAFAYHASFRPSIYLSDEFRAAFVCILFSAGLWPVSLYLRVLGNVYKASHFLYDQPLVVMLSLRAVVIISIIHECISPVDVQ
jgi:hypothetical protein